MNELILESIKFLAYGFIIIILCSCQISNLSLFEWYQKVFIVPIIILFFIVGLIFLLGGLAGIALLFI